MKIPQHIPNGSINHHPLLLTNQSSIMIKYVSHCLYGLRCYYYENSLFCVYPSTIHQINVHSYALCIYVKMSKNTLLCQILFALKRINHNGTIMKILRNTSIFLDLVTKRCIPLDVRRLRNLAENHGQSLDQVLNGKFSIDELLGAVVNLKELSGVR